MQCIFISLFTYDFKLIFALIAPVKESATIYDAFLEKERRTQARQQAENNKHEHHHVAANNSANTAKKNVPVGGKKKAGGGDKRREPSMTLEEAVSKVRLILLCLKCFSQV